ncbi:MAG: hypothetical protein ACR2JX_06695 [Mycobacteriales bacterium]
MDHSNLPSRPVVIVGLVGVGILGIGIQLLLVALFAVAFVSEAVFHTSIDPTESSFAITLHNDTSSTIMLKQCDVTCDSFHERVRLLPGADTRVNTSSDNVANWWMISDADGKKLGCLPLRYGHKIDRLVVNVSEQTACP